ncbi:MAG: hypothetical protein ACLU6O_05405 [Bilophila wadsworthia]|jgi:hypothetical protein|uniref:Uncharacterized protein n=1 Tax=Desulfovibrio legallii TaxID=571438 RepID=A0A1G7QH82_9BACT|nr:MULTISPECIES: hypothetical protein [Desulfovibrionaceae]MBS6828452.1 hypothetical protein [Desulfovibrio sp.]MCB8569656.1 hypothetical protein [Bilophila wadsworthia]MCC2713539.1 hypothetical protein [Bilophila wadsworthia]SDF97808.1 hypothetical protein SAMN05192586_12135 [Desulfovibrio legallii]
MTDKEKDYLKAAVNVVAQQVTDNPLWGGVAVDPDVADWMGAFTESAVTLADLADDVLLSVNAQGDVVYEG